MSFSPPGGNGTMRRTGRSGNSAYVGNATPKSRNTKDTKDTKDFDLFIFEFIFVSFVSLVSFVLKLLRTFNHVPRRRAEHRRALHVPALRLVEVAEREVHRAAVVPRDDVVRAPLVAVDELEACRVLVQVRDERPAFLLGE